MRPFNVRVLPVPLLSLLMLAGCYGRPAPSQEASVKPVEDRNPAPDFSLRDADGKTVTLSEYRGKVVLLNFWATWCGPCRIEIPWFTEFERKHKDQGFAVLGVSMDDGGWDEVKPYLRNAKVNYRILMGDHQVAMLYGGVEALPTSFMIDREGKIASVHVGLVSKWVYENDINELLRTDSGLRRSAGLGGFVALVTGAD